MKTDLNWMLSISAFNMLSDSSLLLLINVGMPIILTFRLLAFEQNSLGESEKMDEMLLL